MQLQACRAGPVSARHQVLRGVRRRAGVRRFWARARGKGVQVCAAAGVAVADQHGIELGGDRLQQLRQGRVAEVGR
jgi:hypothetical protein